MNNVDNMSKSDIILSLLISLNEGNSGVVNNRVDWAVTQYNQLVREGIILEDKK